jgi:hypothetical protein
MLQVEAARLIACVRDCVPRARHRFRNNELNAETTRALVPALAAFQEPLLRYFQVFSEAVKNHVRAACCCCCW